MNDKSVVFQSVDFQSDHIIFRSLLRANAKQCSCCRSFDVRIKETKERTFRTLNISKNELHLKSILIKYCVKNARNKLG